jgi:transglutaminase-like putative cysteine protease
MQIRVGFEMAYRCPQPTPMLLVLNIHHSRASDLVRPDLLVLDPPVALTAYRDLFGNWCSRIVAPAGRIVLKTDALVNDSGLPDPLVPGAMQTPIEYLPESTLVYLLGSRYCENRPAPGRCLEAVRLRTDGLGPGAGGLRFRAPPHRIRLPACAQHQDRVGGLSRGQGRLSRLRPPGDRVLPCLNIPARYCTGYLGDIGMPPPYGTMDFAGWFEAWLGDRWYTFDARNNTPRIGRVLMARGRDACDVALSTAFGPNTLEHFVVRTDEVVAGTPAPAAPAAA